MVRSTGVYYPGYLTFLCYVAYWSLGSRGSGLSRLIEELAKPLKLFLSKWSFAMRFRGSNISVTGSGVIASIPPLVKATVWQICWFPMQLPAVLLCVAGLVAVVTPKVGLLIRFLGIKFGRATC